MQVDTDVNMIADQPEEDQDSLFGSPPPTPIRGRSPSPALALPIPSSSTQNVGTIALPGSHHYSELPVNPLALSLSHTLNGSAPRAPAQSQTMHEMDPHLSQPRSSAFPTPALSRASSVAPSSKPKRSTTKKSKSKESTPRLSAPAIALPDPSDPPPANFLRNQSGLLGTAGLVGGIKPANLSIHRHTRGTNSANPIVVEDEDDPPILGRASRFRHPYTQLVDTSLLPTPSTQDVVAMLIGQKDIFPVLENILRLIAVGSTPATSRSGFTSLPIPSRATEPSAMRPVSSETLRPPIKKRKLNRVPAGAVDWDVPYPFPQGEGPDAYRTTWERERGKQLISQLVSLIKNAARKAATKIYLQNEGAKRAALEAQRSSYAPSQKKTTHSYGDADAVRIHGHYRPSTVTYGLGGEAALTARPQAQEVLVDASNGNARTTVGEGRSLYQPAPSCAASSSAAGQQPSTPFDQLISSLLAASPDRSVTSSGANTDAPAASVEANTHPSTVTSTGTTGEGSDDVDHGLFDSWMNILQTFPMPSGGFEQAKDSQQAQLLCNDGDPNFFNVDSAFDLGVGVDMTSSAAEFYDAMDQLTSCTSPQPQPEGTTDTTNINRSEDNSRDNYISRQSNTDHLIDPALLAISIPRPVQHNAATTTSAANDTRSPPPSLAPSPMPSTSSFGDPGPATPNSATWDAGVPEVFASSAAESVSVEGGLDNGHGTHRGGVDNQGVWQRTLGDSTLEAQRPTVNTGSAEDMINALLGKEKRVAVPTQNKGKGRNIVGALPTSTMAGASTSQAATSTSEKTLNKGDILRRAKERRKQLGAELDQVKTQLWETTIEQGALAYLGRHYT